jgi:hypothetical protein
MTEHKKKKNKESRNFIQNDGSNLTEVLTSGNYQRTRAMAQAILANTASSESSRATAQEAFQRTQCDRGALVAGLVVLIVLLAIIVLLYS